MRFYKYTIVLTPDEEEPDAYNVSVPALPEVATFGESIEEALFMAQDALELVILSRLEEGDNIPPDKKPKRIPENVRVEEIVISVAHQVTATPAKHVKMPSLKSREVLDILFKAGFEKIRTSGSHIRLRKEERLVYYSLAQQKSSTERYAEKYNSSSRNDASGVSLLSLIKS